MVTFIFIIIYTHTHIHTYIYTYIYIYIYIYICINIKNSGKPETVHRYWPVSEIYRTAGQTGIASSTVLTPLLSIPHPNWSRSGHHFVDLNNTKCLCYVLAFVLFCILFLEIINTINFSWDISSLYSTWVALEQKFLQNSWEKANENLIYL